MGQDRIRGEGGLKTPKKSDIIYVRSLSLGSFRNYLQHLLLSDSESKLKSISEYFHKKDKNRLGICESFYRKKIKSSVACTQNS